VQFLGDFVVNGSESLAVSAPGSVEFDENVGEFLSDAREVVSGEDEDVVLFGVGAGQEDQTQQEKYLGE
jgi:hypothetical protein